MGTAVLHSQDCLRDRWFPNKALALSPSPSLKPRRNASNFFVVSSSNSNPNPNPSSSPNAFLNPVSHPNASPNAASRIRRRKRSSPVGPPHDRDANRPRDHSMVVKAPSRNLVMGEVKILKRGEPLSVAPKKGGDMRKPAGRKGDDDLDLVLGSTDRLGPDPETVQMQVRVPDIKAVDLIYAGSGFVASPPPSSVPVPGFVARNGTATSDLRRLLRLSEI